jgi:hypothetical protein
MSHLMSLSGVKRTWRVAAHMSAFDPKRTFHLFSRYPSRRIYVRRDLPPNDVDVTAQIIKLV